MSEGTMISKPCKEDSNLFEILLEAEDDVKCGRVAPIKDTFKNLRMFLGEMEFAVVIEKNLL